MSGTTTMSDKMSGRKENILAAYDTIGKTCHPLSKELKKLIHRCRQDNIAFYSAGKWIDYIVVPRMDDPPVKINDAKIIYWSED